MRFLLLFFFCLLCFATAAAAQADSIATFGLTNNILTTKVYRKGLYRDLHEFKTNRPTGYAYEHMRVRGRTVRDGYRLFVDKAGGDPAEVMEDQPWWGYCDGRNIYVRTKPNKVDLGKLETLGIYCFFTNYAVNPSGYDLFGNRIVHGERLPDNYTEGTSFILNFNTGERSALTNRTVELMLEQDPELKARIGKASKYKGDRVEFVRMYNDRNNELLINQKLLREF